MYIQRKIQVAVNGVNSCEYKSENSVTQKKGLHYEKQIRIICKVTNLTV